MPKVAAPKANIKTKKVSEKPSEKIATAKTSSKKK